ncbi:MAG: hypothetical protein LBI37_02855 [Puniceicoccales bacterium]|jgi:hypothetical protein|nr:hypothetical protein [Puniceicoccales bacterium]
MSGHISRSTVSSTPIGNAPIGNTGGPKKSTDDNNIKLADSSYGFLYLKFKDGLGSASKVSTSSINSKTVIEAKSTGDVTDVDKVIGSVSDKGTIAKTLMEKIAKADKAESNGKNSLTSNRSPGDIVCLKVLSDLVNVARANAGNSQIFKKSDAKELVAIFCPDKLKELEGIDLTDNKAAEELFKAIGDGMASALANTTILDLSKSNKKSLEKVMASTLQSMSGVGRSGYKNMTINGRCDKLASIGKALKFVAIGLAIAAAVAACVASGGTLFAVGGVAISLKIAIGGGIAIGGLATHLAGSNMELNSKITTDIPFKAKLMHNLANAASYLTCIGNIANVISDVFHIEVPFIGPLVAKINIYAKAAMQVAEMTSEIQSLIDMAKADFSNIKDNIRIDIGFQDVLGALKGQNPEKIVAEIQKGFSGILNNITDEKLNSYLDKMESVMGLVSNFCEQSNVIMISISAQSGMEIPKEISNGFQTVNNAMGKMRAAIHAAHVINDAINQEVGSIKGGAELVKNIFSGIMEDGQLTGLLDASDGVKRILAKLGDKFNDKAIDEFMFKQVPDRQKNAFHNAAIKINDFMEKAKSAVNTGIDAGKQVIDGIQKISNIATNTMNSNTTVPS